MTATLDDVTPRNKRPDPSAEELAATELVRLAKEQGLSLTGPDGLLMRTPNRACATVGSTVPHRTVSAAGLGWPARPVVEWSRTVR